MAEKTIINLFRPRSETGSRYAPGWRHIEEATIPLVGAKVLPCKKLDNGNGYDYLGSRHRLVVLNRHIPKAVASQALASHFGEAFTQTCHHEYDCCGCHHAYVGVKHRKGRTYSVTTQHFRNY